jgi:V8-like Glu-specific endopeptidase
MWSPLLADREVIQPDDRQRVPDPLAVPYRWICSLDVTYADGQFSRGSGLLVGPRQVLTAAHNVYRRRDGAGPSSLYVAPARAGRADPFGRTKAVATSLSSRFLTGPPGTGTAPLGVSGRFDVALLTLERDVAGLTHAGLRRGTLGHWGHPTQGHGTVLRALDPAFLAGKAVVVGGYPGDFCGTERYDATRGCDRRDRATRAFVHHGVASFPAGLPGLLLHTADTAPGQSGSPVWIRFRDGSRWLAGVHVDAHRVIDAATGRERPVTANRAVHLSRDLLALVRTWMP